MTVPLDLDPAAPAAPDPAAALLSALAAHLGTPLAQRLVTLPEGVRVEIDGVDTAESLLVQCISATGAVKSSQRNKAMADALKLVWLRATLFAEARIALCVSEPMGRFFRDPAWLAQAARDLRLEVYVASPGGAVEAL
ncbi:hypothetical protein [Subtercola boreus]|uniref:Uncharacterized protein n=1 Tax=Subtercola boreus TaxID=120213 RepID=A0A3E0W6G4_9MICO|nr:hypothetical protein [Subtercola boreus]RFA17995.1 hypothetical protein B7R24_15165 [Subtercola boreus]RFA18377.1 hypothetical protein B7R23_15200 [Subtercola boreus]RFA24906.1 hypothetical protein B7R25_15195 [Subtercola boreus]